MVEIVQYIGAVYNSLFAVKITVVECCAVLGSVCPVGVPLYIGKVFKIDIDDKCLVALVLTVLIVDILNADILILEKLACLDVEDVLALVVKCKGTLSRMRVIPSTVAAVPVDAVLAGACSS